MPEVKRRCSSVCSRGRSHAFSEGGRHCAFPHDRRPTANRRCTFPHDRRPTVNRRCTSPHDRRATANRRCTFLHCQVAIVHRLCRFLHCRLSVANRLCRFPQGPETSVILLCRFLHSRLAVKITGHFSGSFATNRGRWRRPKPAPGAAFGILSGEMDPGPFPKMSGHGAKCPVKWTQGAQAERVEHS